MKGVNLIELRKKFDIISIIERRDYVICKLMYRKYVKKQLDLSDRLVGRNTPLIRLTNFCSETFKKSSLYRGKILWNKIPRHEDVNK